ncbi:MAG: phage tail protein, partial [Thermomicrobiales bacterium]
MSEQSSWVRYLPPVLWEGNDPAAPFSLAGMLRIFEKLLTGIDDAIPIVHGDHTHDAITTQLDRLHRLYDPWTTPPEFLDWLASWVSFSFPNLWDEYTRRKAVGEIVDIYQYRGLKDGLIRYLDFMAIGARQPRIAIDDGNSVLTLVPDPNRQQHLTTLVSQGSSARRDAVTHDLVANFEGITRPSCLALAPDQTVLVGDLGSPGGWTPVVEQHVWQISPEGRYTFTGAQPVPRPIGPPAWNLLAPVAIAIDNAVPWNAYVLDLTVFGGSPALFQLASPDFLAANVIASGGTLGTVWPVAMTWDTNGHLLILDRGAPASAGGPAAPFVIDVTIAPFAVTSTPLPAAVIEPLALLVTTSGDLIVTDAGPQTTISPGNLLRIDRSNPLAWTASSLLPSVVGPGNPLVQPTAIVEERDGLYDVLDGGLKAHLPQLDPPHAPTPVLRQKAQPPVLNSVEKTPVPPTLTQNNARGG